MASKRERQIIKLLARKAESRRGWSTEECEANPRSVDPLKIVEQISDLLIPGKRVLAGIT